jgi:O-antigen ligase
MLKKNSITFLSYCVLAFPAFLLIGPLVAEFFLICITIFALVSIIKQKRYNYFNRFIVFLGLFYISTLFSTLINFYNFDYSKSGLFFFRIPLFTLGIWFILDNKDIFNKQAIKFYIIFFIIIVIDSLLQFSTGKNLLAFEIQNSRVSSFFNDEQVLGGFVAKIIPIFLLFLIMVNIFKKKNINLNYVILFSFLCLIVFLTAERTSIFTLVLFFSLTFLMISQLRKFILYVGIIFLLLIPITFLIKNPNQPHPAERIFLKTFNQFTLSNQEQIKNHIEARKSNKNMTINTNIEQTNKIYFFSQDHHEHYKLALIIAKDHIIFGSGTRGFRYLCRNKIYELENKGGCSTHPHNIYIQILSSNGLVGFIFLIFALIYVIIDLIKCKKNLILSKTYNKILMSRIIILIAIFVNLFPFIPSGNFFNNWYSILYFYPIGFYFYLRNYSN